LLRPIGGALSGPRFAFGLCFSLLRRSSLKLASWVLAVVFILSVGLAAGCWIPSHIEAYQVALAQSQLVWVFRVKLTLHLL
jgi:hypothetical protein